MSEYIIDMGNSSYQSSSGLLCADVSQLREPIVRCRDCKKCNIGWCLHFNNIVKPDGFCAWGERREA